MNVSIGDRWENFVTQAVKSGRYNSASEVIREGLRLVEEREAKLTALRETILAAMEEGEPISEAELDASLDATCQSLERERAQSAI